MKTLFQRRPLAVAASIAGLAGITFLANAQQGDGTDVRAEIAVVKPQKVEATPARLAQIKAPEGFVVKPLATGLKNVRIIAIAPNGNIYVSRRDQGDVLLLKDANGDGTLDAAPVVVTSRAGAHGLAIHDNKLYLATVKEVFSGTILPDGRIGPLELLIGDLPDSGQHPNRTIAFGPDNMLYISAGSTCNACNESNVENATLLRATPDGKSRTIWAAGLRNTIGYAWHPTTGELWGMDQGIDFLGDDLQPEELNKIEKGKRYGWPHVWGEGGITPWTNPAGEISKQTWRQISAPMVAGYTAHAAAMQMVFNSGTQFPADYSGDAFVTFRGSWNRAQPSGYEIVRVDFENGQAKGFKPFVSGFLTDGGKTHIARPVGLAMTKDGAMLMSDDANGTIYRISYAGGASKPPMMLTSPPAAATQAQAGKGIGVPLATKREETAAATRALQVTSTAFRDDTPLAQRFSEYSDGVSPPLSWAPVPGAKSYALIMEDPDSAPITPFVHWVAWNIPPDFTNLPEGLQEQERLTDPEGLMQGINSRGAPAYYGPRPPVGDKPHNYHFQVLALDRTLDLPPGADRDMLLAAAKPYVIAKGDIVGTFKQTVKPPK